MFNSGGIGEDSLPFQNIENLPPKKNSIRNSGSAAIVVASIGASVEKKTAAKSHPYKRKTKTQIENLPPKRNGIHNLDLKRIGKENSESAAISVDSIDANAEKKITARNHLCKKRDRTQVEEELVFPKKLKVLLINVEGSNSIIGNQNELEVRQVEAELDKASNLLEEKQNSFDNQAIQQKESKTKIEGAQKEISGERGQLVRELEGSSNAAIKLNDKEEEISDELDQLDQLARELDGSSNAAIKLNDKVKGLEKKNDQINELNEKVFSIEAERNTLEDQVTKMQSELARKDEKINVLEEERTDLSNQVVQIQKDNDELNKNHMKMSLYVASIEGFIGQSSQQIRQLTQHGKQVEAYAEEQLARKESEIGRLNDQVSKSNQHIEQLKQDKNKKEEVLLDEQNKVKELNDKVNSITNERNCLNSQINSLTQERDTLTNQVQEKKNELSAKEEAFSKVEKQVVQLQKDKEELEAQLLEKGKKFDELEKDKDILTNEIQEKDKRLDEKEEKLNKAREEAKELEAQLESKDEEVSKLKEESEREIGKLIKQEENLNSQINSLTQERDTLTNQVQEKKNELSAKEEAFSKLQTNAQDLTYKVNQKDQQLEQVVREKQRLEAKFRGLNEKYSEVKNKDRECIENLTYKLEQAKSEFIDNENKLSDQIEKLKEEKEILLEQLRAKSTGSASFRKQQSKIDSLKQQLKEKEEPKSIRNLEQLQNISGQDKIETTVPENSAESELNSTQLTEFEGNNTHVQASAAPAATVTSMNVKNIEKVPVMLETPSDKSGSQKLISVQQEMSSVANESSGQVNGSQTNGMQPNNSSNGSILVTQSVQKNKWPTTATWKLAIAGVLVGIAASVAYFTFSASLLVTGVIAGVGACCLVAAAIVYYCNKPSSSLEKRVASIKLQSMDILQQQVVNKYSGLLLNNLL